MSPKPNPKEENPKEEAVKASSKEETTKEAGIKEKTAPKEGGKNKAEKGAPKEAGAKVKQEKAPSVEGSAKTKPEKAGQKEGVSKGKAEKAAPKEEAKEKTEKVKVVKTKPRLKEKFVAEVMPVLYKEFKYSNVMQVPRLKKVVLNIGLGEAIQNPKALESAEKDLSTIAGQHPVTTRSKRSISAFKLRVGMPVGMMVTLRGDRMYHFLDRLYNVVLPRLRDFQGISAESFDGRGNYSFGMKEQIVFPEIEYDKVEKLRGLEVTIATTARTDDEARRLLELMGMPFRKAEKK